MSDVAINVENLSKRYRIGGPKEPYGSLRDSLMTAAKAPLRALRRESGQKASTDFWALKDVSFEVKQGEVLGIIGRNGAGKSTLLKILSRITEPTAGRAEIRGRVGSLLEVGTGFHPELTGRENIYLNGAILGMSRADIERSFEAIVEFSEIQSFLDTPVKRYSSGMYMRLAFSIAAHLEPDILVVDEVLAVGDAQFQQKCLGKMDEVADQGRTVLFVSHNNAALLSLCTSGLVLRDGQVASTGPIKSVLDEYLAQSLSGGGNVILQPATDDSSHEFRFRRVKVYPPGDRPTDDIRRESGVIVQITYEVRKPMRNCQVGFELWNSHGTCILTSMNLDSDDLNHGVEIPGEYTAMCHIPGDLLRGGRYSLTIGASVPNVRHLDYRDRIVSFDVRDVSSTESKMPLARNGVIMPSLPWQIEKTSHQELLDVRG